MKRYMVFVCAHKHSWRYYWNSSETIMRVSGSSRGADWLKWWRELKQAVSLGINAFPPSPWLGMKHMEPIKTWESYGIAEPNTATTRREAHRKERSRGKKISPLWLGQNGKIVFHIDLQQQSSPFSLSTKGNKMKEFVWGQWKYTASIKSAYNV